MTICRRRRRRVATTDFRDSPKGLFSSPPQCYMHRQASFIPAFFPKAPRSVKTRLLLLPGLCDKDLGKPVLGAGTLWAITNDSPGAQALIKFLQSPIAHEVWMAQKGFLTPYKASTPMSSPTDAARR
jgi:alpha-glucoside transport system substrate-binding protein